MANANVIAVEKDGKTVLIDKDSLDVYLKFGYKLKSAPVTDKKEK